MVSYIKLRNQNPAGRRGFDFSKTHVIVFASSHEGDYMSKIYDAIVVGLRAMGSAALYQLSLRTSNILGLEQFSLFHEMGSSHGDSRVYRQAIGEGSFYAPLVIRSLEIAKKLEHRTNLELFTRTGGLIMASPSVNSSLHGSKDFLGETIRSAQEHAIYHEALDLAGIKNISSQFNLLGDEMGYYERGAGFMRPENCIRAQLSQALLNGAQIHSEEQVIGIDPKSEDIVSVKTDNKEYSARKVIICAGPWIGKILGSKYDKLFQVHRQVLYWFDIGDNFLDFSPRWFPVFLWIRGREFLYGFPAIDGRFGGVKVASEVNDPVDPDMVDRNVTDKEIKEMSEKVKQFLPALNSSVCLKSKACLYTETSDKHFVIDYHPEMSNVIIASPCSGHGFKHSLAIGQVLAEMAIDDKSTFDIDPFSLKRFKV